MQYNLKDKIEITADFLNELITKSWQEVETIQQQIANIDSSSQLGAEVSKLLKNVCTGYYTLIGCLEDAAEEPSAIKLATKAVNEPVTEVLQNRSDEFDAEVVNTETSTLNIATIVDVKQDFEPFEYFVDFDEPIGDPLSDKDLYN